MAVVVDEAHCVEKWGATFRQEFSNIGEARSIIPRGVNMMALTATASRSTQEAVQASLCMHDCYVISKLPNKLNIKYVVKSKPEDESAILLGMVDDVRSKGINADKCIIFCPTYNDCNVIFQALVDLLGECLYLDGSNISVCNLYTAAGDTDVKDAILDEFTKVDGYLRFVISTITFGMGLDAPNIRRVIHWGPSRSIEAYVQESGRCGRDNAKSVSELYFTGSDFSGFFRPTKEMKDYCKSVDVCRRQHLMQHFAIGGICDIAKPLQPHDCCDICSSQCECMDCFFAITAEELDDASIKCSDSESSSVSLAQKLVVVNKLKEYRLALCKDKGTLFGVEIASGLPDYLIKIIANNVTVCTEEYLLNLGLSSECVTAVCKIVFNALN